MTSTEFNLSILIRVYRSARAEFKKVEAATPPPPWRHEAHARLQGLTTALEVMTTGLHSTPNPLQD